MKYKSEFFVGLFFLLGIISFFFLVFKISNLGYFYNSGNEYKLKAIFKNIGNLKKRARVTVGGVKIGDVVNISLKRNDNLEYYPEVEIKINSDIKIPEDSTASILMNSLLGDSYIQIELGNEDKFLSDGDSIILTTQALIIEDLISKFAFNK